MRSVLISITFPLVRSSGIYLLKSYTAPHLWAYDDSYSRKGDDLILVYFSVASTPTTNIKESITAKTNEAIIEYQPTMFSEPVSMLTEKAKMDEEQKFALGDVHPHPYDYSITRNLYKEFGLVTGIIDKYVDHIIGPGFHVKSDNKAAEKIIQDYIDETNLALYLRPAFKEALITGFGPLEIISKKNSIPSGFETINSATLFIKKDDTGFRQIIGGMQQDPVDFSENQIICFEVNKMPGQRYGLGIIYPALRIINNYLKSEKDLHTLVERKANTPVHVALGDRDKKIIPSASAVSDFGKKLQTMRATTEWCTDAYVEMKTLDFGNVGDKFSVVLENDKQMLYDAFQIPEVILGHGDVAEGLAKVQLDVWDRTINALREEFEKVIENDLFDVILEANGLDAHVELEWESPSESARQYQISQIMEALKLFDIDPRLRNSLELKFAELIGVEYTQTPEVERQNELGAKQPLVPGQNAKPPMAEEKPEAEAEEHNHQDILEIKRHLIEDMDIVDSLPEDVTAEKWVGFDYAQYIDYIESFIDSKEFVKRTYNSFHYTNPAHTHWARNLVTYSLTDNLSEKQVDKLRNVLKFNLRNNNTMREIIKDIVSDVKPGDLIVQIPEQIDKAGNVVRKAYEKTIPERLRSSMIARSETVRSSNQGALLKYKADGVNEVVWVSALSDRTCEFCDAQNGKVLTESEADQQLPAHTNCRCTFIPYVRG